MRQDPRSWLLFAGVLLAACQVAPAAPGGAEADRPAAEPVVVDGLRFAPQPGWESRPPASSSRVAQFELPGGDSGDPAELVIYHFGSGAGSIEANLDRWCDQFEQPGGGDSRLAARVEHREVAGLAVHCVDVAGTYVAETSPGSGQRVREPDHRLLAAIVETDAGPYYVKLVGRAEVLARWESSFAAFLESLEPAR